MEREDRSQQIRRYVENMQRIRLLSTPDVSGIDDPDDYVRVLTKNFSQIGELARENRQLIDEVKPILSSEESLSDAMRASIMQLVSLLVSEETFEEVDVHMSEVLDEILIRDEIAHAEEDNDARVVSMARKVQRDYFILSALTRYRNDEVDAIRNKALDNRNRLASYLDKNAFATLSDEAKGATLRFSLMGALLYENNLYALPDAWWEEGLAIVDQAEAILADPFYREQLPDYEWDTYEFRIYYYGSFFVYSYIPAHIALRVHRFAQKAVDFLERCHNEAILSAVSVEQERKLMELAAVLAHLQSPRSVCDDLYWAFEARDRTDYSVTGIDENLDTPSLYLRTAKQANLELTEADFDRFHEIEHAVIEYVYRLPKRSDAYMKCATLVTNYPVYFQEVPGAMSLEAFCLSTFAAIHPPTYVHCNMVARLAQCMMRHLLRTHPELLVGFPGCDTVEQVQENREHIVDYTYHASLCHDIGKLFIIDTISMYGRNLLDDEFMMIRSHPSTGACLAREHASTRVYADVIEGHHLWYDGTRGYPMGFDRAASPYATVIDVVTAADCLDAATDSVGRSYSRKKTFADLEQEIRAGVGTRYAPFLPDLFADSALRQDLEYLLDEGRRRLYRETFHLLKSH